MVVLMGLSPISSNALLEATQMRFTPQNHKKGRAITSSSDGLD